MAAQNNEISKKKSSLILIGLSVVLSVLFIIIFLKTFSSITIPQLSKQTTDCPGGFSVFDNNSYDICYPKDWEIHYDNDITYADGSVSHDNVSFINPANTNEQLHVIPNLGMLAGKDPCLTQDTVMIHGFTVLRMMYREHTKQNTCGDIVSYHSIFQSRPTSDPLKKGIVIAYVSDKKVSLSSSQYATVENSLVIKDNGQQ